MVARSTENAWRCFWFTSSFINARSDEGIITATAQMKTHGHAHSRNPYLRCSHLVLDGSSEVGTQGVPGRHGPQYLVCETVRPYSVQYAALWNTTWRWSESLGPGHICRISCELWAKITTNLRPTYRYIYIWENDDINLTFDKDIIMTQITQRRISRTAI